MESFWAATATQNAAIRKSWAATARKIRDKDIIIEKNKLKNETPGSYIDYELELIKKDKFYSLKKNRNLEKINNLFLQE